MGVTGYAEEKEGQSHWFNEEKAQVRVNPTGPEHAQVAVLAGITEYFDALHLHHFGHTQGNRHTRAKAVFEMVARHESTLANILLDYVKDTPDIRLLGQDHAAPGQRAATVAFHARTIPSTVIAKQLAEHRIGVGAGDFYARRCVEALDIDPDDGVVLVSMVHYNTPEEVVQLVKILDHIFKAA